MASPIFMIETFVAFILAIGLHGAAHAGMAALLGDSSPLSKGRLSLNPMRQMSAVGTIVAIVHCVVFPPAGLGWGKPVDVDARRLRVGPNFGLILVALAGPLFNLALGLGVAFLVTLIPGYDHLASTYLTNCLPQDHISGRSLEMCLGSAQDAYVLRIEQFAIAFAVTSVSIALLNIIPLHPLDGYKILFALLPSRQAIAYRNLEPYMEFFLLILLFLVPYILSILSISFSPGVWIIQLAYRLVQAVATYVAQY
ncbi:MAG: site-2 protease family protein, partial [Ktedonobacterales bacterium]